MAAREAAKKRSSSQVTLPASSSSSSASASPPVTSSSTKVTIHKPSVDNAKRAKTTNGNAATATSQHNGNASKPASAPDRKTKAEEKAAKAKRKETEMAGSGKSHGRKKSREFFDDEEENFWEKEEVKEEDVPGSWDTSDDEADTHFNSESNAVNHSESGTVRKSPDDGILGRKGEDVKRKTPSPHRPRSQGPPGLKEREVESSSSRKSTPDFVAANQPPPLLTASNNVPSSGGASNSNSRPAKLPHFDPFRMDTASSSNRLTPPSDRVPTPLPQVSHHLTNGSLNHVTSLTTSHSPPAQNLPTRSPPGLGTSFNPFEQFQQPKRPVQVNHRI